MSERNRKAAEASRGVGADSAASQVAVGGGSTGTSSTRAEKELLRRYSTNPVQMAKLTANYNKSIERIEYTAEQSAVAQPPTPAHRVKTRAVCNFKSQRKKSTILFIV